METLESTQGTVAPENASDLLGAKAAEGGNKPRSLYVDVIQLRQKDVPMYMGKMTARDLLTLYDIDAFKEQTLDGYQRELYRNRASEIFEYLAECPIAVMPGVFVSLRSAGHAFRPGRQAG